MVMPDMPGAGPSSGRAALVAALAAGAGFLTRPCCVLPALLAFGGTGSAAMAQTLAAQRPALLVVSAGLVGASIWMNVRLRARPLNKWLTAVAAVASFALASGFEWFLHD
jgi:pimeloyl-ACP methyl ester carboxylesterase